MCAYSQAGKPLTADPGYRSITESDLRSHLEVLTADSLGGRETGTIGQERAAAYIASQFKKFGLKPCGDEGTYFQNFDLILKRVKNDSRVTVKTANGSKDFFWWKDVLSSARRDSTVSGPVVFVGFQAGSLSKTLRPLKT